MRLSKLISRLQHLEKTYGDIEVVLETNMGGRRRIYKSLYRASFEAYNPIQTFDAGELYFETTPAIILEG